MNAAPKQHFTRGRAVEYMAYNLLLAKGYHAVMSAGKTSPVDIIAWRCGGDQILVKTERAKTRLNTPELVARRYAPDLAALRAMAVPPFADRHLWVWDAWHDWRFFSVFTGGICEVDCV
jgi:hypothetical protein